MIKFCSEIPGNVSDMVYASATDAPFESLQVELLYFGSAYSKELLLMHVVGTDYIRVM